MNSNVINSDPHFTSRTDYFLKNTIPAMNTDSTQPSGSNMNPMLPIFKD